MKDNSDFIVFDMDSTLIRIECIDDITRLNDRYTKVSTITEAAMRGDIGFSGCLHPQMASPADTLKIDQATGVNASAAPQLRVFRVTETRVRYR